MKKVFLILLIIICVMSGCATVDKNSTDTIYIDQSQLNGYNVSFTDISYETGVYDYSGWDIEWGGTRMMLSQTQKRL